MAKRGELLVGLDIGTTKVCAIVGEHTDEGINVLGVGMRPSKGIRKGVVINIDATVDSIRQAVEEAELMANCEVTTVYAGIAGSHIRSFNSHGVVAVKDGEVSQADIERVIENASALAIPTDTEVIHVIPQEYIIDEQDGITEPLGMSGVRLEAKVHIVTGYVTSAQNIIKCANKCGLEVADIVLEPLASSEAVLSEDEKELGCALVDIGGGTTDIAIWSRGTIVHTSVLPLGGNHLTSDIAVGLRTPLAEAERVKQKYGCAMVSMVGADETAEVPSTGGRQPREIPRKILAEIIEYRVEEIFSLVHQQLEESGYADNIAAGVIITGGSTILEGMPEMAESVLEMPVRRGIPQGYGGLVDIVKSPRYATGLGLVQYGASNPESSLFKVQDKKMFQKVKRKMISWFKDIV